MLFGDRLAAAVDAKRSQLVVGLDPMPELLPRELRDAPAAAAAERFCRGIVEAVAPYAVAVKPQLAFFEALGAAGFRAFERVCTHARAVGLLVIADGKRGDIGSTARAYAGAYLHGLADALTVNPYLGRESLEPFLDACREHGSGLFCLVKTSNAGADVQDLELVDGSLLWQHVARLVDVWGEGTIGDRGLSSVGAVVGATHPAAVAEARRLLPHAVLLLPGVGAQGGSPAQLGPAFAGNAAGALVTASRSVIYAYRAGDDDWRRAAAGEAARLRAEVWAAAGG
jgi:orotidine-5'-phosphate decarboxylase